MHSLKNTAVAVILLGISFGLYQISLTPKPQIDPSQIPTIDISEGLSSLGNPAIDGGQAKNEASSLLGAVPDLKSLGSNVANIAGDLKSQFPNVPKIEPPTLPPVTPKTTSPAITESARQPIVSTTSNGVQSIQYPGTGMTGGNPNENIANQFNNNFTNSTSDKATIQPPKIAQREIVDPNKDRGLIEALKTQSSGDNSFAASNQFSPTVKTPTSEPTKSDNSFSAPPKTAQKIGTAKSSNDLAATELVSTDAPMRKSSSEFGSGSGADANVKQPVQQANLSSNFDQLNYKTVWPKVDELVAAGEFRTALQLLTRFYRDENLTGPQRQRLVGWLDALAGKVIFSDEDHLTGMPYLASSSESLTDIAMTWNVPAQLIYNVNKKSLPNPVAVASGTKLKQIDGPFNAEVNLEAGVMTLFLNDLYAGRFTTVRTGVSGEPKPGKFKVVVKSEAGHAWRDANGKDYPPGSAENGYGPHWMGLSGSLCIHAIADSVTSGHHGCIGLSESEAKDVFAILSEGSQVKIVR